MQDAVIAVHRGGHAAEARRRADRALAVVPGAARARRWRWAAVPAPGFRTYLAVSGGIDVPAYLGSRATYVPGAIGGFEGRALKKGDRLPSAMPAAILDAARRPDG